MLKRLLKKKKKKSNQQLRTLKYLSKVVYGRYQIPIVLYQLIMSLDDNSSEDYVRELSYKTKVLLRGYHYYKDNPEQEEKINRKLREEFKIITD